MPVSLKVSPYLLAVAIAVGAMSGRILSRLDSIRSKPVKCRCKSPLKSVRSKEPLTSGNFSFATIVTDEFNNITIADAAAAHLFGINTEEIQGSKLSRFISNEGAFTSNKGQNIDLEELGLPVGPTNIQLNSFSIGIHANGERFPISLSVTEVSESKCAIYRISHKHIPTEMTGGAPSRSPDDALRQLSAALQTVREQERSYVARELHDDLGQLLASLQMDLSLLSQRPISDAQSAMLIGKLGFNISASLISLRRIAAHLRPRSLDDGGLFFALKALREEFASRYSIACHFFADEHELQLDDEASTTIYRVIQEALTNIGRHASAKTVTLTLYQTDGELLVTIHDDGRGINELDMKKTESFGLIGMHERISSLNGEIKITGEKNVGTSIDIIIPIKEHQINQAS